MSEPILVLADRADVAALIARYLGTIGRRPLVVADLRQASLALEREPCAAVVLDLAVPAHCDAAMRWLKRDPARAGLAIVRVSALVRHGGLPRGEIRADACVPKPFTPRQLTDAVRTALARRAALRTAVMPRAAASTARHVGALAAP